MSQIFGNTAAAATTAANPGTPVDPTLAFIQGLAAPSAQTEGGSSKSNRKPAQLWVNVGVTVPGMGEDGGSVFVSLPVGIPLDDLKPAEVKGGNPKWVALQQAKNGLLALIQQQAANLNPGERKAMPLLSIELSRANGVQAATDDTGALSQAVAGIFAGTADNGS